MANEEDDELSNILMDDDEFTANFPFDLDLSTENKTTNKRLKAVLRCVVCGDDAYGYNFDAISCESCKAFFRRNALRPPTRLKCRGNGHCEVTVETRKRCKKCRLDKCFEMGMRKEWILSDEEKTKKKRKIEENRRLKQSNDTTTTTTATTPSHHRRRAQTNSRTDNSSSGDASSPPIKTNDLISIMTESDWSKIHQIQTAYSEAVLYNQVVGVPLYPATHTIRSTLELIRVPTHLSSARIITFMKKIPEFHLLDSEDRVTLVKHNLLASIFMHIVLIYDPIADAYHEHNTQDPIFEGKDWIQILGTDFYHDLTSTATKLIKILEYDRVIVKLLILIILLIKGFCAYDLLHEPSLNHMSVVFSTQNAYAEILYKYCLHQYGLTKTIKLFTNLINQLFAIQRSAIHLKNFVHSTHVDVSQLTPLMQSVLQVSDQSQCS